MTYEQAMARLEQLAAAMEAGDTGVDELAERLAEAQELLKYCRGRLYDADQAARRILQPEA